MLDLLQDVNLTQVDLDLGCHLAAPRRCELNIDLTTAAQNICRT